MIDRKVFAVLGLALASLMVLSNAHASELDQTTKLTFSQPVQIPGQILPAGTYWFVVEDPTSDSKIIRIFSEDRSTARATLLTASSEHLRPSEGTEITFANGRSMQPQAIVTWFYPGETIGHEFLYSKQERKEMAQAKQYTVVAAANGVVPVNQRTVAVGE